MAKTYNRPFYNKPHATKRDLPQPPTDFDKAVKAWERHNDNALMSMELAQLMVELKAAKERADRYQVMLIEIHVLCKEAPAQGLACDILNIIKNG